jgi:hypothetical protein
MKESHIESEAIIALSKVHRQVKPEHHLAVLIVMQGTCDAIDKGDVGKDALLALIDLWRELKFREITGESISELRAVVDRMYEKAVSASRARER